MNTNSTRFSIWGFIPGFKNPLLLAIASGFILAMPGFASSYDPTATDPYNFNSTGLTQLITQYFTQLYSSYAQSIATEVNDALGISLPLGALGLPEADQVDATLPSISAGDGSVNPEILHGIQKVTAERASTTGALNAQLSADQQQQEADNQDSIAQAVQAANDAADAADAANDCAQNATVTQEILKCVATIQYLATNQMVSVSTILQANYDNTEAEKTGHYQMVDTLKAIQASLQQSEWQDSLGSTLSSIGATTNSGFFAGLIQEVKP